MYGFREGIQKGNHDFFGVVSLLRSLLPFHRRKGSARRIGVKLDKKCRNLNPLRQPDGCHLSQRERELQAVKSRGVVSTALKQFKIQYGTEACFDALLMPENS